MTLVCVRVAGMVGEPRGLLSPWDSVLYLLVWGKVAEIEGIVLGCVQRERRAGLCAELGGR